MTGAKLQTLANLGTNMARELLETRPTFWHGVSDHRNFRFPSSPIEICKSQGNALKLLICSGFGFCGFFPDTLRWFDLSPVQLCGKVARRWQEELLVSLLPESSQVCLLFPCSYAATEVFLCGFFFLMHCQEQGCPKNGSPCDCFLSPSVTFRFCSL